MMELDRLVLFRLLSKVAKGLKGELTNAVVERMAKYRDDPVRFAVEVLGLRPWSRQRQILEAVAKYSGVLVRSGHKLGKSTSAIILALWFVATRPRARVLLTAPTAAQIKRVLWREMGLHYPRVATILEGPPELPKDPATGLTFSGDREIFGRASRTKEGAAGVSGPEMLFIVDEASGFSDEQYEALIGNAASRVKVAAFSNPTRAAGWFFHGFRNGLWFTLHISSEDSPNVVHELARRQRGEGALADDEPDPVPGLANLAWIEKMRRECGANYRRHPIYQVRVLGQFPSSGPNAIVSLLAVERARRRWDKFVEANLRAGLPLDHGIWGALELGVDPARYGDDDAVIQPRRALFCYGPRVLSGETDGQAIADATVQCVRELRQPRMDDLPVRVKIDPLGRAGADTCAALRHHEACRAGELVVVEVDVNKPADDADRYSDLRTQLWFAGADWLSEGLEEPETEGDDEAAEEIDLDGPMLPPEPRLTEELLAATFRFDARGRQLARSKDEMRAELERSPDHADAFNLAVYGAPMARVEVMTAADLERIERSGRRRRDAPERWGY